MKLKMIGLTMLLLGVFNYCSHSDTIHIGFVGNLSGRLSDVGVDARNGAMLAVEEINKKGGIKGKKIELIIKDDQNNPETAKKIVKELIDQKVIAIIGHIVSGMSLATLPIINEKKMLMISPTSVSNNFNGLDDYFIRVSPGNNYAVSYYADYIYKKMNLKTMSFIYDLSNKSYSEDWYKNFKNKYLSVGGKELQTITFNSGLKPEFGLIAKKILKDSPKAVTLIAGAIDTALLAQQIKKISPNIQIIISGWAMTEDLIKNGGKAVEGSLISYNFDKDSQEPAYIAFKDNFKKRFGVNPNFTAKFSYETMSMFEQVLNKATRYDSDTLKKMIISQGTFKGLQGDFSIDSYGDAVAKIFIFTVQNGVFVKKK